MRRVVEATFAPLPLTTHSSPAFFARRRSAAWRNAIAVRCSFHDVRLFREHTAALRFHQPLRFF
jgi:hypothetical protein